jgi:excisionase family DNA binding protein
MALVTCQLAIRLHLGSDARVVIILHLWYTAGGPADCEGNVFSVLDLLELYTHLSRPHRWPPASRPAAQGSRQPESEPRRLWRPHERSECMTKKKMPDPLDGLRQQEFLTQGELALLLRCSLKSVQREIERGNIMVLRVGRLVRIPRAEVDRLMQPDREARGSA